MSKNNLNKKKILVFGYYGRYNFGDDLLAISIAKNLRLDNEDITILVGNTSFKKKLTKLGIKTEKRNLFSLSVNILKCNNFILGGGTYFHGSYKPGFLNYIYTLRIFLFSLLLCLLRLFKKKVKLLGVGYGPFNSFFIKIAAYFSLVAANSILVRDKKSYLEIKKLNKKFLKKTYIGRDLLELEANKLKKISKSNKKKNVIGLSIINMDNFLKSKKNVYKELTNALIKKLRSNPRLSLNVFALWSTPNKKKENDIEISKKVITYIKSEVSNKVRLYIYDNNPEHILKEISKCKIFISTRLHSFLSAYYLNTNCGLITYNIKCLNVANTLKFNKELIISPKKLMQKKNSLKFVNKLFSNNTKKIKIDKKFVDKFKTVLKK
jgi:polysaccharide pyruvyl transferase WcaK-like protein